MPAAAVIPAPIAYIKVVAVKKLVVGSPGSARGPPRGGLLRVAALVFAGRRPVHFTMCRSWPERLL